MSAQGYYQNQGPPQYPQQRFASPIPLIHIFHQYNTTNTSLNSYGAPQGGQYQQGPPMNYQQGPPPGQYYPPQQQMGYAQGPPPQQKQKKDRGCLASCLAVLCCCFVCEEGCECCADCCECAEDCC